MKFSSTRKTTGCSLTFHFKPRSQFSQFDLTVLLLVDMVSKRDEIILIDEGDRAMAVFLRNGKQIFQDVHRSLSQFRRHIRKDQMWILFRHWTGIGNVVTHHHVAQRERGRGSRRQENISAERTANERTHKENG